MTTSFLRLSLLALALGAALSANAVSILNDNFDSGYAVRSLNNQQGYSTAYSNVPFNVNATAGVSGSYGVTTDTSIATGESIDYAFRSLDYTPTAATPSLNASVDVASLGFKTAHSYNSASAFGLSVFNGAGDQLGLIFIQFAVGLTPQTTVYYQTDYTSGASSYSRFVTTGGANTFKTLGISFDTRSNSATFLLNGAVIGNSTYSGSDAMIADVDLTSRTGGYDIGVFDNLKLDAVAAPVPEPASLAALGLGGLAMLRRRKASRPQIVPSVNQ